MLKNHWRAVTGYLLSAYGLLKAFLDLIGYVDLVVSHSTSPTTTWLGRLMAFLLYPPEWTVFPIVVFGLALIWWDSKRRTATSKMDLRSAWGEYRGQGRKIALPAAPTTPAPKPKFISAPDLFEAPDKEVPTILALGTHWDPIDETSKNVPPPAPKPEGDESR